MRATVVNDVAAQEGGLVLMWRTGETAAAHTHGQGGILHIMNQ